MNGMKVVEKYCKACRENHPIEEFYTHKSTKDGYLNHCKKYKKEQQRTYKNRIAGQDVGETFAVQKLSSLGIYAERTGTPDVTAWGCVKIEVKRADYNADKCCYAFNFTNQYHSGLVADLILLIPQKGQKISFHIFPADHPVFYRIVKSKRRLKSGVMFRENRKNKPHDRFGMILSPDLMAEYENRWDLIEQKRMEISRQLILRNE